MGKPKQITVELCSKHDTSDRCVAYEVGELIDWHTLDLGALYLEPMQLRLAKVKINFQVGSVLDMKVKFKPEDEATLKNIEVKIGDLEIPVVFSLHKLSS